MAVVKRVVLVALGVLLAACGGGSDGGTALGDGDADRGRGLYNTSCAACHGSMGEGTPSGPPLVHRTYVPSHHADVAFLIAVQRGVRPHHWDFGPMPALPGLSTQDVADIVAYVRERQREAGLIE